MYDKDIKQDHEMKRHLIDEALRVLPNSYALYSHYNVAAAVLMSSGKIYTGVNVESASLSATICAERNAIFSAVADGEREIIAVAVTGGLDFDNEAEYCVPCGICRQVMRDFGDKDSLLILCAKTPDDYREFTLEELLPQSFGPESLMQKARSAK